MDETRASDAEREGAGERLRLAAGEGRLTFEELSERIDAAYEATTRGELERLLADLPVPGELVLPGGAAAPSVAPTGATRASLVAVMGGRDLRGRCRIGRQTRLVAVMGGIDVDLNDAVLEHHEVVFEVACIMGGVDLRVPDGVHVIDEVTAIMGGVDVRGPAEEPPPGAPVVRLRGFVLMGGVDVKRGRRRSERRKARRAGELPPPPALRAPPPPPSP